MHFRPRNQRFGKKNCIQKGVQIVFGSSILIADYILVLAAWIMSNDWLFVQKPTRNDGTGSGVS
jgi:hypothetical protein